MYSADPTYIQTSDNLVSSRTSLKLQLQSSHFGSPVHAPQGNGLILRCTARIGNLYQENAEIELGVPQRDPIPARGKLSSFYVTGEINSRAFRLCGGGVLPIIYYILSQNTHSRYNI